MLLDAFSNLKREIKSTTWTQKLIICVCVCVCGVEESRPWSVSATAEENQATYWFSLK